jgi:hypothetical protein
VWELYSPDDYTQTRNIDAEEPPAKLTELQRLWLIEAAKSKVRAARRSRLLALFDLNGVM